MKNKQKCFHIVWLEIRQIRWKYNKNKINYFFFIDNPLQKMLLHFFMLLGSLLFLAHT